MADEDDLNSRPSRYHSHRQRSDSNTPQPYGIGSNRASPGSRDVSRSRSRYRRRADTSDGASPPPFVANPVGDTFHTPDVPSRYRSLSRKRKNQHQPITCQAQKSGQASREQVGRGALLARAGDQQVTPSSRDGRRQGPKSSAAPPTDPEVTAKPSVSSTGPTRSQSRRRDGPPSSSEIRATKSLSALPKQDTNSKGFCWGLFNRKLGNLRSAVETVPPLPKSAVVPAATPNLSTIRPGGGGVVPGTDAPISAVNAGDRHVLIECGSSRTLFPVTPSTTPVDLIKSAATCMSERINTKSAILLEYFSSVGVHRPLRSYEHVRDVMNSWDNDTQNSLLLVDPGTGSCEAELSLTGVPSERPQEQTWVLLHSQKVGKWEKRKIILREDGQIVSQKDADKPKDQVNICHLSDFDVYSPTQEKLKKKIKPPKRHCLAIKSQQKTSIFESTENFVHFFSTADRANSDDFQRAVQTWRSWYLVHVLGEGGKARIKGDFVKEITLGRSNTNKGHRVMASTDSHYQLGSFKPLDMRADEFHEPPEAHGPTTVPNTSTLVNTSKQFNNNSLLERRKSTQKPITSAQYPVLLREDEPLPDLNRTKSNSQHTHQSGTQLSDSEFKASGLLGRSYSQKQRELAGRPEHHETAFTQGPSLINSAFDVNAPDQNDTGPEALKKRQSLRRPVNHPINMRTGGAAHDATSKQVRPSDLQRLTSRAREKSQRVNELETARIELSQPSPQGRGFRPGDVGRGGLIGHTINSTDPANFSASGERHDRGTLTGRAQYASKSMPMSEPSSIQAQQAFTGNGLLAGVQDNQSRGVTAKARGAVENSVANGKPLLDLTTESEFVQGSLLNSIERANGPAVPIIDRDYKDKR